MPFISCAACGAHTGTAQTLCPHCGARPRPRHATAVAVLCNCASIVLGVTLVMSHSTGVRHAPGPAAQLPERPSFCGDKRDCLAGAEVAQAITQFISR